MRAGLDDHDLVFTHIDVRPLDPSSVTKTLFALVKRSGLSHVNVRARATATAPTR